MVYNYVCDCGESKDVECNMKDPLPEVMCEKCNKKMYQDMKSKFSRGNGGIIIPMNFRAAGEEMYMYQKAYGKNSVHEKQIY